MVIANHDEVEIDEQFFGAILQYPAKYGEVIDYSDFVNQIKAIGVGVVVAADLLSLSLLTPPAEWGADVVVGTTQRFGIPMGYGGPHAAYFATFEKYKRSIPGRIIGVSEDRMEIEHLEWLCKQGSSILKEKKQHQIFALHKSC